MLLLGLLLKIGEGELSPFLLYYLLSLLLAKTDSELLAFLERVTLALEVVFGQKISSLN